MNLSIGIKDELGEIKTERILQVSRGYESLTHTRAGIIRNLARGLYAYPKTDPQLAAVVTRFAATESGLRPDISLSAQGEPHACVGERHRLTPRA